MRLILPLLFSLYLLQTSSLSAYVSYHLYTDSTPLTSCACSDGSNGLITRWGYQDLSSLFPYVSAFSQAPWNSPNCGDCIQVSYGGNAVYLTVVDLCGPPPSGEDAHFDISEPAFQELVGSTEQGTVEASWQYVGAGSCKGNLGR